MRNFSADELPGAAWAAWATEKERRTQVKEAAQAAVACENQLLLSDMLVKAQVDPCAVVFDITATRVCAYLGEGDLVFERHGDSDRAYLTVRRVGQLTKYRVLHLCDIGKALEAMEWNRARQENAYNDLAGQAGTNTRRHTP